PPPAPRAGGQAPARRRRARLLLAARRDGGGISDARDRRSRGEAGAPLLERRRPRAGGHGREYPALLDPIPPDALHRPGDAPLRVGPPLSAAAGAAPRVPAFGDLPGRAARPTRPLGE